MCCSYFNVFWIILFPVGNGIPPSCTALAASAAGPVAWAVCVAVRPFWAAVSALACNVDATNTLRETSGSPKGVFVSVLSERTKVIVQFTLIPSVSFSSPKEIWRSPSGVFSSKSTFNAIGRAAGCVPVGEVKPDDDLVGEEDPVDPGLEPDELPTIISFMRGFDFSV
jgi:hypothetical protein